MKPASRILTDVTWAVLILGTGLLWFVYDGAIQGATVVPLMAIIFVKAVLIAAVFMDLWRTVRPVFFALALMMGIIGLGIILLS